MCGGCGCPAEYYQAEVKMNFMLLVDIRMHFRIQQWEDGKCTGKNEASESKIVICMVVCMRFLPCYDKDI